MHVSALSLRDFRNYREADLRLEPGVTVLVGRNGQGKTNLVEAIGFLGTLVSHRTSIDRAMIRAGEPHAVVRAIVTYGARSFRLELELHDGSANKATVGGTAAKPRDLPRYLARVLFAPEDLSIVRGDPSGRRRTIDQVLVSRTPRFAGVLSDYDRVLRQRNSLLKSARQARVSDSALSTLEVWDERMIELGSSIISARQQLIEDLQPHLVGAYDAVAGTQHVPTMRMRHSIVERSSADDADEDTLGDGTGLVQAQVPQLFRDSLAAVRRAELDRGISLVGPHRDDLVLGLNALPVKGYASHGETWSFVLGLKLAVAQLLRQESLAGDPILVLDDVFAELDEGRRTRLAAAIQDYEQVLITAAVEADIPESLTGRVIKIDAGQVLEEAP